MFPHIGFNFPYDVIDIFVVAFLIYRILLLLKGTRAFQVLLGLIVLVVAFVGSQLLDLIAMNWILNGFLSSFILVVVILFQNDLRRALAQMGKHPNFWAIGREDAAQLDAVEELVRASTALASRSIGALIAVERETRLRDHVETGVLINGLLSREVLQAIFLQNSPIHDGAVIVGGDKVVWAGCFLPLTTRMDVDKAFGTRHRAALGLTEETDAVAIVVSEERGTVSIAVNGRITRDLDSATLRKVLTRLLAKRGGAKARKKKQKPRPRPLDKEETSAREDVAKEDSAREERP